MRITIFMFTIALLLSCEAPRMNPLDPKADNFASEAQTRIFIAHFNQRNTGIANVRITEPTLGITALSNNAGFINFLHPQVQTLKLIAEHQNFFTDTVYIAVKGEKSTASIFLNDIPTYSQFKFYSIYDNLTAKSKLIISTHVNDFDGIVDMNQFFIENEQTQFKKELTLREGNRFETSFALSEIAPSITNESIIEYPFKLTLKNQNGNLLTTGPYFIKRIIEQQIITTAPKNNILQKGEITFKWQKVSLNYNFSYRIDVYTFSDLATPAFQIENIASKDSSYTLSDLQLLNKLEAEDNFWFLNIIDSQGNISSSKYNFFNYTK